MRYIITIEQNGGEYLGQVIINTDILVQRDDYTISLSCGDITFDEKIVDISEG